MSADPENAWPIADECHEEVTRRGELQPCDKPAVALRIDPEGGPLHPYPVCAYHARTPMVPLRDLRDLSGPGSGSTTEVAPSSSSTAVRGVAGGYVGSACY